MDKKLILLIEDDRELLLSLSDFIEMDGIYDVVGVKSGSEAFQWLANNPSPAAVITDFYLPELTGDSIAKAVHRMGIPVIILSAAPQAAADAVIDNGVRIPVVSKIKSAHSILAIIDTITATNIKKVTA